MSNIREFFHSTIATTVDEDTPIVDALPVKLAEMGSKNFYGQANALAGGATAAIVTVIVPPGETYYLQRSEFSGENKAVFSLYIDDIKQSTYRTWWCHFNGCFDYTGTPSYGIKVSEGKTISLEVLNNGPVASFEGRIQVIPVVNTL
jgi:hypothetical protein